ncbi:MAG: PAS domain S-box protein [Melioribacteraceae bacterium]|nr:PAS domain S-box protein [Melioribacteraceae bacterium]
MVLVDLIYRLSLLFVLIVLAGFVSQKFDRQKPIGKILQGLLFGAAALMGMLYPFILTEGIIFDGRSIAISLCALFFGPVSGALSATIALIYRLYLGGDGVFMGVGVITTSYLVGLFFYYRNNIKVRIKLSNIELFSMGFIIHFIMLALMITLPDNTISNEFFLVALSIVGVYPILTMLTGKILLDQFLNQSYLEEITRSEKLLRTTLNSIGDAVITTDITGLVKNINPVAEKLLGWHEADIKERPLEEIFKIMDENTRSRLENPVQEVLDKNKVVVLGNNTVLVSKTGDEIPIATSGAPIRNENNDISGVVLVFRDQSAEREALNKLKELSELQNAILENASYGLIATTPEGIINVFNPAAEHMLGYKAHEVIGKHSPRLFHVPEEVMERAKILSQELNINISPGIDVFTARTKFGLTDEFEWTFVHKNGNRFPVQLSITAFYNEEGVITGYLAIAIDITERKKAEQELLKFKMGIDKTTDAIFITDLDGVIQYVNPAFQFTYGFSTGEVIGKTPRILKSGSVNDQTYKKIWERLLQGKTVTGEIINRTKDGRLITIEGSNNPIFNNTGKMIGFMGIHRDITDKKKMVNDLLEAKDAAEKANQLKSEFLAQMSHEIRSPINAILNFTTLIEDELKDSAGDDLVSCFMGIDSASKRVIRTIDSILNMSELQLGTYEISKRIIDIGEMLKNLEMEYSKLVSYKSLEFILSVHSDENIIIADDYAVNQIFVNLIDNAVKYTENGFIRIDIMKSDRGESVVSIQDSGKGISKEYLPYLFEPFSQEEHGYTRKFEGNGLGMSLVKKYCDLINAEITVESELNEGTKFTLIFNRSKK